MTQWHWYVYIIECLDDSYYTGCTWNIENRFLSHILKCGSRYTRKHGVKRLAYYEEHYDLDVARRREKQIKGWTRKKKEMLISRKWGKE